MLNRVVAPCCFGGVCRAKPSATALSDAKSPPGGRQNQHCLGGGGGSMYIFRFSCLYLVALRYFRRSTKSISGRRMTPYSWTDPCARGELRADYISFVCIILWVCAKFLKIYRKLMKHGKVEYFRLFICLLCVHFAGRPNLFWAGE